MVYLVPTTCTFNPTNDPLPLDIVWLSGERVGGLGLKWFSDSQIDTFTHLAFHN